MSHYNGDPATDPDVECVACGNPYWAALLECYWCEQWVCVDHEQAHPDCWHNKVEAKR
jgi:hypothetical protein